MIWSSKRKLAAAVLMSLVMVTPPLVAAGGIATTCAAMFSRKTWSEPWQQESTPHPWAGTVFTSPAHHSDSSFLYLVHANRPLILAQQLPNFEKYTSGKALQVTSFSVVSQEYAGTLSRSGFIIDVAPENIVAAIPNDFGSIGDYMKDRLNYGVLPPTELIAKTGWSDNDGRRVRTYFFPDILTEPHNECIVASRYVQADGAVTRPKIVGIFVKTGTDAAPEDELRAAESLSHKTGLPLVRINTRFPETVVAQ